MQQTAFQASSASGVQVLYQGRLSENKMNEAHNARVIREAIYWARFEGDRIIADGKTIWAGMGNRAGCYIADQLISEKWAKSGERFEKKLRALPAGTRIEIRTFRNRDRCSGTWSYVKAYTLL